MVKGLRPGFHLGKEQILFKKKVAAGSIRKSRGLKGIKTPSLNIVTHNNALAMRHFYIDAQN